MKVTKKVLTYSLEFIVFVILLILFVVFYMKNEVGDYTKQRTSVTTRNENSTELEFPSIVFCMKPGSKVSVAQKYNLEKLEDFFDSDDSVFFREKLANLSFNLNEDFQIFINENSLHLGMNFIRDISPRRNRQLDLPYMVESIVTIHHATCIKIQPEFTVKADGFQLDFKVQLKDSLLEKPRGFYLYLTSNKTWAGIVAENWINFQPTKVYVDFQTTFVGYKLFVTQQKFSEGETDISQCQANHNSNCNCSTVTYANLPLCHATADTVCKPGYKGWYQDCFKPRMVLTFNPIEFDVENYLPINPLSSTVSLILWSMIKEIKEEIPVITTTNFIGSLGGSLGMFFGFSFAAPLIYILRLILNKCLKNSE